MANVNHVVLSNDRDAIGASLGRVPSGCAILTATHGSQATGVLVSWFQQASFDPPMVSVALRQGRPAGSLVEKSGRFLLNLMGSNPTQMFRHFGRGFSLDEDAFAGLDCEPTEYGMLLRNCVAHLACSFIQKVTAGDHDLYLARIDRAAAPAASVSPYVHLRSSGFSY